MTEQQKQKLLEEAKKRYPVGNKFWSVYNKSRRELNDFCIVVSNVFEFSSSGDIYCRANRGYDKEKDALTLVYYGEEWAEIIESPVENYSIF